MKAILLAPTMYLLFFIYARDTGERVQKLRNLYFDAAEGKCDAEKLWDATEGTGLNDAPLLIGYKGAACFLMARDCYNPYSKLLYFNRGKKYMDSAVNLLPDDAEIRFLRFTVQENAPSFLNYSDHLSIDKTIILNYWKNIPDDRTKNEIRRYMLHSLKLSDAEKKKLM